MGGYEGGDGGTGTRNTYNLQVVGCTIENTLADTGKSDFKEIGVGGVYGNQSSEQNVRMWGITVRDCKIIGPKYVGGIIGAAAFTQDRVLH